MLIKDLQLVLKIAQFRSITAAATHLDMRMATASAALKRVEVALGITLFVRTTRHLKLSSAGEKYIPQCEQALLLLEKAEQNLKGVDDEIEGELRITLSSDLGRNIVTPWLDEFMDLYPKVTLRAHITDSNIDFYRDPVDMALRYGSPDDANLYGFKICNVPGLLCAAPEYIAQYGAPEHPQELSSHRGLFYQLYDVTNDVWLFTQNEQQYKIKMSGNRSTNDGDLVRRWCVSGKGLAVKSCLDMSNDLLSGKVVSVMRGFTPRSTELWLVCPNRQSISPAVRLLRDTLRIKTADALGKLVAKGILNPELV